MVFPLTEGVAPYSLLPRKQSLPPASRRAISIRGRWLDMSNLPAWLMNAPAWMVEQWLARPPMLDDRAVALSAEAALEALKERRVFCWFVVVFVCFFFFF